tara:strand:- start:509 stop:1228 length:720 start_codon:yes stop_codon:yes gene_type:complete
MSKAQRIQEIIDYYGMSYNSFAISLGMLNGTSIKRIVDDNRNPQNQTLNKIVNTYPEINMNWLRTGTGQMISNLPESLSSNDDLTVTAKQVINQLDINNLHYSALLDKKMSDDREYYDSVTKYNTSNHSKNIASLLEGFKSLENRLETKFQEQEIKMDLNATNRSSKVSQVIGEKIDAMNKHWDIINQERHKLFLTALDKVISLENDLEDIKMFMATNFELDKMNKKKSKQINRLNPKD